ncbi:MAG TPA: alpha/beta hydrolase [Candidatus Binataceae bacterium]|nr:alpha/beta hydrolase [Candidatus Binataceae bacterium]
MYESKFVTANGLRLHYLDFGNPSAPPVVCIHGLTANAHSFDDVAPQLASRYHVISVDVRGRGESQWGPVAEYTLPPYVSDLNAMLEALNIPRASLIGTSMGGMISMTFAILFPGKVERIVLNDIGPEIDPVGLKRIMDYVVEPPQEFKDMAAVVAYYRAIYPPIANDTDAAVIEWVKWSVKPTEHGTLTWKMDPGVRQALRDALKNPPPQIDTWKPYASIKAPILVVRGGESDILSLVTARKMCEVSPNTKMVEVPGVGHAPFLTEPVAVKALAEFFGV